MSLECDKFIWYGVESKAWAYKTSDNLSSITKEHVSTFGKMYNNILSLVSLGCRRISMKINTGLCYRLKQEYSYKNLNVSLRTKLISSISLN